MPIYDYNGGMLKVTTNKEFRMNNTLKLIDNNDILDLCKRIVFDTCGLTAHEIEAALDEIAEIFPDVVKVVNQWPNLSQGYGTIQYNKKQTS